MLGSGQAKGWLSGWVGDRRERVEEGEREESCSGGARASESAFEPICGRSRVRLGRLLGCGGWKLLPPGIPIL